MSVITQAFLAAGLLIAVAGLVAWRTRRARRITTVWLVPPDSQIAHAFRQVDLKKLDEVTAVRHCGTWSVAELHVNEHAERCWPCRRAVELSEKSP